MLIVPTQAGFAQVSLDTSRRRRVRVAAAHTHHGCTIWSYGVIRRFCQAHYLHQHAAAHTVLCGVGTVSLRAFQQYIARPGRCMGGMHTVRSYGHTVPPYHHMVLPCRASHLEDHVLGRRPLGELAGQLHADDLGMGRQWEGAQSEYVQRGSVNEPPSRSRGWVPPIEAGANGWSMAARPTRWSVACMVHG